MCGHWGYIDTRVGGTNEKEAKVLRSLAVAGTLRGWDGTGLFYKEVKAKKEDSSVFYIKDAKTGSELLNKHTWEDSLSDLRFVAGHNRAATIGKCDQENTHPFCYPNVIGSHNGTIHGWRTLFPDTKAGLDSDAIMEALNDADDALEVLPSLSAGAYALVWYDHRTDEVRIARNDERPMHFVRTAYGIWWASELKMLEWCLDREGVQMLESWELAPLTLARMPLDGSEGTVAAYKADYSHAGYGYGSYGYSSSTYRSPANGSLLLTDGWDDVYDLDDAATYWNKHDYGIPAEPLKNLSTLPDTSFRLRSYNTIDTLKVLPYDIECRIIDTIKDTLGAPESHSSLYSDMAGFSAAARAYIDAKYTQGSGPRVPIVIVALDDRIAYGYVEVEGIKVPATVKVYNAKVKDTMSTILKANTGVLLSCPLIDCVRVFSNGDISLEISDVISDTFTSATALDDLDLARGEGAQLVWKYYYESTSVIELEEGLKETWLNGWKEEAA